MAAEVKVETDISAIERATQSIVDTSNKLPFDKVAEKLERHIRNTFQDQTDPWGHEWAKWLHPKQIKASRARRDIYSDSILLDTRALFDSILREHDATSLTITMGNTEKTKEYAYVHQYGDATHDPRPVFPSHTPDEGAIPEQWIQDVFGPIQQAFLEAKI